MEWAGGATDAAHSLEIAMRFWFVHSGEVSLREQIVTQVMLGIVSGELRPGERLPSTRELARRFRLHSNTVSAAYRLLERDGRVETRHGSGVFVRAAKANDETAVDGLDEAAADGILAELFVQARKRGVADAVMRGRLARWLATPPPHHVLVVEPDEELRRIVVSEVEKEARVPVRSCGIEDLKANKATGNGAVVVTLPSKVAIVRELLGPGAEVVTLQVRSVPRSLVEWLPAPVGSMVGVASRWQEFLKHAQTMLVAAGVENERVILRDAREKGWLRGMEQAVAVVCDVVTAEDLPRKIRAIPFRLLAESSITELRRVEATILTRLDDLS